MERSDAPRQVSVLDLPEPGAADHLGELALPRETPNALDKIAVGIAVAGVDPAYEPIAYGLFIVVAVALSIDRSINAIVK